MNHFIMGYFIFVSSSGSEEILLPEDHMLSGFVPLLALPLKPLYVSKKVDKVSVSITTNY